MTECNQLMEKGCKQLKDMIPSDGTTVHRMETMSKELTEMQAMLDGRIVTVESLQLERDRLTTALYTIASELQSTRDASPLSVNVNVTITCGMSPYSSFEAILALVADFNRHNTDRVLGAWVSNIRLDEATNVYHFTLDVRSDTNQHHPPRPSPQQQQQQQQTMLTPIAQTVLAGVSLGAGVLSTDSVSVGAVVSSSSIVKK